MTSPASRATTTRAKTTTATTSAAGTSRLTALTNRRAHRPATQDLLVVLCCLAAVASFAPAAADASDATLRTRLGTWSHRIALDARGVGLSASLRHPRRMMRRARHFRADALSALRALAPVRPTSARGRRAKRLALAAFRDYAVVGRQWALSGQARIAGRDRKSTRLNSSHTVISYAVFCLKKKTGTYPTRQ